MEAGLDVGERGAKGRQQDDKRRHLQWDACEGALLMTRRTPVRLLSCPKRLLRRLKQPLRGVGPPRLATSEAH